MIESGHSHDVDTTRYNFVLQGLVLDNNVGLLALSNPSALP